VNEIGNARVGVHRESGHRHRVLRAWYARTLEGAKNVPVAQQ